MVLQRVGDNGCVCEGGVVGDVFVCVCVCVCVDVGVGVGG